MWKSSDSLLKLHPSQLTQIAAAVTSSSAIQNSGGIVAKSR